MTRTYVLDELCILSVGPAGIVPQVLVHLIAWTEQQVLHTMALSSPEQHAVKIPTPIGHVMFGTLLIEATALTTRTAFATNVSDLPESLAASAFEALIQCKKRVNAK